MTEEQEYASSGDAIDRDAREFEKDVRVVVARTLPELVDRPVDDTVGSLSTRLQEARSAEEKRTTLMNQREDLENSLEAAQQKISQFRAALDEMLRQASCDDYEQLPEAATRSRKRRELEKAVNDLEDLISSQSGGNDFHAFVAEAEAADVDRLEPAVVGPDGMGGMVVGENEENVGTLIRSGEHRDREGEEGSVDGEKFHGWARVLAQRSRGGKRFFGRGCPPAMAHDYPRPTGRKSALFPTVLVVSGICAPLSAP